MARRLLGTASTLAMRVRVYLAADALEVDEIEWYTGTRRRVLLDEVLLITMDRRRRWGTVAMWLLLALVFSIPALIGALAADQSARALAFSAVVAGPFLLLALLQIVLGANYVTVFGKRSVAQMTFHWIRRRRARDVFALVRDRARSAQDAARTRAPQPLDESGGSTSVA